MNEKAAYLALHGFVACVHDHATGYKIKRQLENGEGRISSTRRGGWIYGNSTDLSSYTVVPWDTVPDEVMDALKWEMLTGFVEAN